MTENSNREMRIYFLSERLSRKQKLEDLRKLTFTKNNFILWGSEDTTADELQRFVVGAFLDASEIPNMSFLTGS
jgi:hypothetical protein